VKNFQTKFSNPPEEKEIEESKQTYEDKEIKQYEPEFIPQYPASQIQSNSQPDLYENKPAERIASQKRSSLADYEVINQSTFGKKPAEQQTVKSIIGK
jgi:hypothetical protein